MVSTSFLQFVFGPSQTCCDHGSPWGPSPKDEQTAEGKEMDEQTTEGKETAEQMIERDDEYKAIQIAFS